MSISLLLKNNLTNIPPSIGRIINKIPYSLRPGLGTIYRNRKKEIAFFEQSNILETKAFIFEKMKTLVDFSYSNIKFYKDYYDKVGFKPSDLISFEDISKIPIINKSILNQFPLEDRSYKFKDSYVVNTGGSSGTPFSFYILPDSMGHEWAHMHSIWEKLGYKSSDLKLLFGGRSDIQNLLNYDVLRNHFAIDIYASYDKVSKKLKKILKKYKIKYLHGYPSSIYDFAVYCEKFDPELLKLLRKSLKGAFLGSEYPHYHYRNKIEEVFNIKTISWYGHTERAVLAYEKEKPFHYSPFISYGYAEAVINNLKEWELVSTSYYNFTSPLIRYNTEDIIDDPITENGVLTSFKIVKGRSGEFVIDRLGKSINLTALIFGRHHKLFNYSKFIQIKQLENGKLEVYYVSDIIPEHEASEYFDQENLNFDLSFKKLDEPIRSISGKVGLLIK
ncbi:hypothetical protein GCM10022216_32130 [Sphingobacterium kyonggiense]|uniref:Phenylacetate-CoA ligase n=1 Tax=Sphingobacterium kyonggiense TaxID=714075 RepID=A0ABP7Z3W9_9SPHI